jgi:hypothetical protein
MATKKTAANPPAKKTSKKNAEPKPAKKTTKASAAPAPNPAPRKTRGVAPTVEALEKAMKGEPAALSEIAKKLGVSGPTVRKAIKGLGDRVTMTGKTRSRKYALAV